jgi:hypothetical protein
MDKRPENDEIGVSAAICEGRSTEGGAVAHDHQRQVTVARAAMVRRRRALGELAK